MRDPRWDQIFIPGGKGGIPPPKVGSRHSHLGSWMGLPGSRLYPAWHFTWDNTGLCLWWNAVYQLTCDSCNQQYIESTTCFIHNPVKEHLNNNKNSSIKKHIYSPQKKDYKGIDVKTIMSKKLIPRKNVVNLQTFYFSSLSHRPLFSTFRGPLSADGPSLEPCVQFSVYLYSFHT